MDPPPFTLLSNKGQSEIINKNIFLTFQWLCLILYLYKQFLRLGQNLPLSYPLLWSKLKRTWSQITSNFYVSNWKSSHDVDNEMARNIARVKIRMVISLVKLSFLFNSEITVFHRYLHNNPLYSKQLLNLVLVEDCGGI